MSNLINSNNTITYEHLFDPKYEIGVSIQDKNSFPAHFHDYIEIVCQIDGSSEHLIDGKKITLNKQEVLIINTEQIHENKASDSNVINLIISNKFLSSIIIESAFDPEVNKIKKELIRRTHTDKYYINNTSFDLINKLYKNYINQGNMYYLLQKTLITYFLIEFISNTKLTGIKNKNKDQDIITYLQKNLKDASLNEYAKLSNYSPSMLSTKIKQQYNMTFIDILQEMRLKKAVDLLLNTNTSIENIMGEVGYLNRTHFYKLFKEKYKATPREFRKANQQH